MAPKEAFHLLAGRVRTDVLRKLYPDKRVYNVWDYFRNAWERNAGLRIDHFLISPTVPALIKEVRWNVGVDAWA